MHCPVPWSALTADTLHRSPGCLYHTAVTATQTQSHLCYYSDLILITCPVNTGISNYKIKPSCLFFLLFYFNMHHGLTKRANATGDQRQQLPLFAAEAFPGPQLRATDRILTLTLHSRCRRSPALPRSPGPAWQPDRGLMAPCGGRPETSEGPGSVRRVSPVCRRQCQGWAPRLDTAAGAQTCTELPKERRDGRTSDRGFVTAGARASTPRTAAVAGGSSRSSAGSAFSPVFQLKPFPPAERCCPSRDLQALPGATRCCPQPRGSGQRQRPGEPRGPELGTPAAPLPAPRRQQCG